jgi:hypothetical protein
MTSRSLFEKLGGMIFCVVLVFLMCIFGGGAYPRWMDKLDD